MTDMQPRPFVEFFEDAVLNESRSAELGHAAYDSVEMVRIVFPGDKFTQAELKVKPEHREEYAREYALFKAGQEQVPEGTPITEWPAIDKGWSQTLKAAQVFTVEQLASVDDGRLNGLGMGARDLREKARRFVKLAEGSAPMEAQARVIEQLQAQQAIDREMIAALKAQVDRLTPLAEAVAGVGGIVSPHPQMVRN